MDALERQGRIVAMVQSKGRIRIEDVCDEFDVSSMTARRDLNELDRQGLLRRVHGGAIVSLGRSYEPPFQMRSTKNQSSKTAIGRKAAELVYDGDSIALDVGTTTLEIVPGLAARTNLTILTNGMKIANRVAESLPLESAVRLIVTGGVVRAGELSMIGSVPEYSCQEFHVDKAFIGIGGITVQDGLTEYNADDARIKQMLIRTAHEKIVVADGAKFGVTTFASVAPLEAIDRIVTDRQAPPAALDEIRRRGVEIIVAD